MGAIYDAGSVVVSRGAIDCAINTKAPLPPEAWVHIGTLAYAIQKCTTALNAISREPAT